MPAGPARPVPPREPRASGMAAGGRGAPRAPAVEPREPELPARRLSRLPLILGAATGVLLCAVALAALFLFNGRGAASPEAAGQALCADLQAQNYDAVYSVLAPPLQGAGTSAQFAASQRELDALSGKVVSCTATVQQSDSSQASLQLTITRQQTGTSEARVHMQLVDGAWEVDSYDTANV